PPQRRYDPYSNTYNPGWKDHPNLQYGARPPGFQQPYQQHRPPFQPPFQQHPSSSKSATSLSKLEYHGSGKLPSQTIVNPKENASAIILRSDKELEQPKLTRKHDEEKELEVSTQPKESKGEQPKKIVIPPPFPSRFAKSKKEEQENEILETFRRVEVNIPLLDAIKQVPRYAKFLKILCTSKRKLIGNEKVHMGENVSAVIQKKLPSKCKDPDNSSKSSPILLGRPFLKTSRTVIDVHDGTLIMEFDGEAPKVELKKLPSHLKYVFLGEGETLPMIISNNLSPLQDERLIRFLKDHKEAIGWTIADIKGISPSTCMHKILMEKGSKPSRQAQRRLNPPMMEVVKKEIQKLLEEDMIFPISNIPWVSPIQVVPKKTGITVVENEDGELVPTQVFIKFQWRRRTKKRPHSHAHLVHLLIVVCLLVFAMPQPHFKSNILGHIVSSKGIEVDKAKIDVIKSLPYPTNIRGVRSFLGHARFYRRFIKDFSKISRPLCALLQKEVEFEFSEECRIAFEKLKELLTSVPIVQPPNWNFPFEIMCDASNYALGVVLEQRVGKAAHVIYYASRTLDST
ncbi:Retrovirus-related Pol polyprotein from transposon 297-like protein, partial [Drosera capensis]